MKLILPDFICGDNSEMNLQCSNLIEMYQCLEASDKNVANKVFEDDGKIKRNVILVANDKVVKRSQYDQVEFKDDVILEILLQLAGG